MTPAALPAPAAEALADVFGGARVLSVTPLGGGMIHRAARVEISSGSLGHGLPLAVGTAIGLRAQGIAARVVVLVGDAELDEGSNHEALELAAALGLGALTVVVIDNGSSSYAVPGRIAERFATEGWHAVTVDGRDHDELEAALSARPGRPNVVVAVVEGKR